MDLLNEAQKQLNFLKKMKQTILEQLKNAPSGTLRLSKSNGTFQYHVKNQNKQTYIRKKNIQMAKTIAQRDYNKKLLPFLDQNIASLEYFTKKYIPSNCENCFTKLPEARKLLVKPLFLNDIIYAKQWQAQKYEPNRDSPTGNYFTTKDEHVRSKSEMIIANLLNTKDIPYHYEVPVKINSSLVLHPDFLCLNKRTRQEFYWEHCGMMDDSEYSGNLVKRLAIYAQKNIIPGKNLILTMETLEQPLNIKEVEKVIDAFLK